jgi:hypothetical protein
MCTCILDKTSTRLLFSTLLLGRLMTLSGATTRPPFAAQVNKAVIKAPGEVTDQPDELEDPDDWLNIDAADLDSFLAQKMKTGKDKPDGAMDVDLAGLEADNEDTGKDMLAKEQAARLQDLAKRVEKFLGGKGDVEGAKFEECVLPFGATNIS